MANHDVEQGTEITDHYRRNRDPVVLSVVISDSSPRGSALKRCGEVRTLSNELSDPRGNGLGHAAPTSPVVMRAHRSPRRRRKISGPDLDAGVDPVGGVGCTPPTT